MNMLESPLEALAFDYVSFGIFTVVNNLWTWVALLTAAISFWRIKSTSSSSSEQQPLLSSSAICIERQDKNQIDHQPAVLETSLPEPSVTPSPISSFFDTASSSRLRPSSGFEDDSVTKGKFVMYYEDDRVNDGNYVDGDGLTVVSEWGRREWPGSWDERIVIRMRLMNEMGWHRCQDLTVINGNVVRLWDGVRSGNYSSGCAVW